MKQNNIHLGIQYPYPIHKMSAYKNSITKFNNSLTNTEIFAKQIFSLPIYPSIENYKINKVIKILNQI